MKKHLILLAALMAFVSPTFAQTVALPKAITNGFDTYKASGSAKAVTAWLTGSPVGTSTNITSLTTYFSGIETTNGAYVGYEPIGIVTISPSVKEYYTVILYQNGIVFDSMEVYSVGGKDIITNYNNGSLASAILPASFLVKDKVAKP